MNGAAHSNEKPVRRLRRAVGGNQRGQSLVEFALILPVLLVVIMGIIDFGMMYSKYVTITNAAREGARYGIIGSYTSSQITTQVQNETGFSASDLNNLAVTVTGAQGGTGTDLTVKATYTYSLITPLAALMTLLPGGKSVPGTVTLSSSTTMRNE